ncbi:ATP-binding protein [Streptomyces sp. NPDC002513]
MPTPPAGPASRPSPSALPKDIEWRLPRHARSVGRARTLLREQAASWKLPDEVTDTAVLLLSELMTNAYRHAKVPPGREMRARCVLEADRLRVSVTDADGTLPTPPPARPRRTTSPAGAWPWWRRWRRSGAPNPAPAASARPSGSS